VDRDPQGVEQGLDTRIASSAETQQTKDLADALQKFV